MVHPAYAYLQYFSRDLASRVRRRHSGEVWPGGRLQGHANTLWLFSLPVSIRGGLAIPKSPSPLVFYLFKGNLSGISWEFLIDFYASKEWQIFLQSRNCSDIRTSKVGRKSKKPVHQGKCRPPHSGTLTALYTVQDKIQKALPASNGTHLEPPSFPSFKNCPPTAAIRTSNSLFFHFGPENHRVCKKMGCSVLNTFQPKSMVKNRRGHGSALLRNVRSASNNTDRLCHVHFLFSKAY